MVHSPSDTSATLAQSDSSPMYPSGTTSVAVQLGSPKWPVTVKTAGEPGAASADGGDTMPLSQVRLTLTGSVLPSS